MAKYKNTGFVTLKNLNFAGSIDDLYDELVEGGEDLVELGVPADVAERFDSTWDGKELYSWLVDNALPLFTKEEN